MTQQQYIIRRKLNIGERTPCPPDVKGGYIAMPYVLFSCRLGTYLFNWK